MNYKDERELIDYWNDDQSLDTDISSGTYISISGNTGSGKSTLVASLSNKISKLVDSRKIVGINERVFHHPLLKLMFSAPHEYAFFIQTNFLMQRWALLYRLLSLGHVVIIERSHLDDMLFMQNHYDNKHITDDDFFVYKSLSKLLLSQLPDPDFMVLLTIEPELSYHRVTMAEQNHERPIEFPNDQKKKQYIYSWHKNYQAFFAQLESDKNFQKRLQNTTIMRVDATRETNHIIDSIMSEIRVHLRANAL